MVIKVSLIAFLWVCIISSGLVNADSDTRLKMAHAWWTGTSEVEVYKPNNRGDQLFLGVIGKGGKRYVPYDLGQSLLMLPGDWLGTQLSPWFPKLGDRDLRGLIVNLVIFIPLNVAAVLACYWLLRLFDFGEKLAGLSSIVWLLGTTVLHYTQVPQQNNQLLLFVIIGYAAALAYAKTAIPRFAIFSGLALGAAMLIRMTSILHVLTVFFFLMGCIVYQSRDKLQILKSGGLWIIGFVPLIFLGRFLDYLRYGSFWTTGSTLVKQQLNTDPIYAGLPEFPANYPFIYPPQVGILGALFSPAKSIFIYDPLLLPCIVLGVVLWKQLSPYIQLYLITGVLNIGLHLAFYSRFEFWHGDAAWGARYHVTSVQLLLIPLVALFIQTLLSARKRLTRWLLRSVLLIAILVQIFSITLFFALESAQGELLPSETRYWDFRLGHRITNVACQVRALWSHSTFAQYCSGDSIRELSASGEVLTAHQKRIKFFLSNPPNQLAPLPFNYARFGLSRKWIFLIWGVGVMIAIATTVRFFLLA